MSLQHLEAKHWLFEGELSSQTHLRLHISWNTHFQLLFSTNTTSLLTGLSKYWVELSDLSEAPSNGLTWTLSLLSLYTLAVQATGQCLLLVLVIQCPQLDSFDFGCSIFPFWPVSRTCFLHLTQNLLATLHSSPLFPWISVWGIKIARRWHRYSWFHCKKVNGA